MNEEQLKQLYASFAEIYGDGTPIRGPIELIAAIHAAGLDPESVSADWLKALNADWVYGKSLLPFQDPSANRLYERFLKQR